MKGKSKLKTREYFYAIANEVTGLDLVRSIWAIDLADAKAQARAKAKLFGRSTKVVSVEKA